MIEQNQIFFFRVVRSLIPSGICKLRSPPPSSCPAGKSLNSTSFLSEQEFRDGGDRTRQTGGGGGVLHLESTLAHGAVTDVWREGTHVQAVCHLLRGPWLAMNWAVLST